MPRRTTVDNAIVARVGTRREWLGEPRIPGLLWLTTWGHHDHHLMLGGTPAPWLVLGGAVLATHAPDPRFDTNGPNPDPNVQATLVIVGPFVDLFIGRHNGFHLGAGDGRGDE